MILNKMRLGLPHIDSKETSVPVTWISMRSISFIIGTDENPDYEAPIDTNLKFVVPQMNPKVFAPSCKTHDGGIE